MTNSYRKNVIIMERTKGLIPLNRSVAQDCCTLGHFTHSPTVLMCPSQIQGGFSLI